MRGNAQFCRFWVVPHRKGGIKWKREWRQKRGVCILAAVAVVLALAPAALAQSSGAGYGGEGGGVAGEVEGGPRSGATPWGRGEAGADAAPPLLRPATRNRVACWRSLGSMSH